MNFVVRTPTWLVGLPAVITADEAQKVMTDFFHGNRAHTFISLYDRVALAEEGLNIEQFVPELHAYRVMRWLED